jgi:hypothetical protein
MVVGGAYEFSLKRRSRQFVQLFAGFCVAHFFRRNGVGKKRLIIANCTTHGDIPQPFTPGKFASVLGRIGFSAGPIKGKAGMDLGVSKNNVPGGFPAGHD